MVASGAKPSFRIAALLALLAAAASGCSTVAVRDRLRPEHADFLSKVRYIISRSEEKIFRGLPDSKRDDFIEEFWRRRQPDPYSQENEFKTEYFARLEAADKLFRGEERPGWLTDRGRIYILFGPPLDRIIDPISSDPRLKCAETWYYGGFPVVFRDGDCSGRYELVTYDLTSLREFNLVYMYELNQAQYRAQSTSFREREPFDFRAALAPASPGGVPASGVIRLVIPYAGIWFREPAVGSLVTTLELEIELRDAAGLTRWRYDEAFDVSAREEILEQEPGSALTKEIPLVYAGYRARAGDEKAVLWIRLKNRTGEEERTEQLSVRWGDLRVRRPG